VIISPRTSESAKKAQDIGKICGSGRPPRLAGSSSWVRWPAWHARNIKNHISRRVSFLSLGGEFSPLLCHILLLANFRQQCRAEERPLFCISVSAWTRTGARVCTYYKFRLFAVNTNMPCFLLDAASSRPSAVKARLLELLPL